MRRGLIVPVLLVVSVAVLPGTVQAAERTSVELDVPDRFAFANATLALGEVRGSPAVVNGTGAVQVRSLSLPSGVLYVCPAQSGQRGSIPPLPVLQNYCRGEDRYEDPELTVGGRTWFTSRGELSVHRWPRASSSLLWEGENGSLAWAGAISGDGLEASPTDRRWAFRPLTGSTEITVEDGDSPGYYNGTGWIFYLVAEGPVSIQAEGAFGRFVDDPQLSVRTADVDAIRGTLEPRTLLDLQDAVRGADAREPVRNATRLFEDYARIPHLVDAGLLGYLDGSLGERGLDPASVTLVHVEDANLTYEGGRLLGTADVSYTRSAGALSEGAGEAAGVPWLVPALLWTVAVAGLVRRDAPRSSGREGQDQRNERWWRWRWRWRRSRWVGPLVGLLAFVLWDLMLWATIGTSGLVMVFQGGRLGETLALLGFELAALGLAWLLAYLPARLALERWTPDRWVQWVQPSLGVLALALVALLPGTMIALGQLVARL